MAIHGQNIQRELSVKNRELLKRVNNDVTKYDILFFQAPMGWGKYPFFREFTAGYIGKDSIHWLETDSEKEIGQQIAEIPEKDGRIIMIPWLERIIGQGQWKLIWELILHKRKKDTFLISSTVPMPEELSSFSVFYRTITYGIKDLKPSKEDVKLFFAEIEMTLYEDELLRIEKDFHNMPLCLYLLENSLRESPKGYCRAVRQQCLQDVYTYIDLFFFKSFRLEEQNALLKLSCVGKINTESVQYLLEISQKEAAAFIYMLKQKGSILTNTPKGLEFEKLFGYFLRWASNRYMEQEQRLNLYKRLMDYSEQMEQWYDALRLAHILKAVDRIPKYLTAVLRERMDNHRLLELEKYLEDLQEKKTV